MRRKKQRRELFKSKGEHQTEAVQIAENKLNELFFDFLWSSFYCNLKNILQNKIFWQKDIFWKQNFWCGKFNANFRLLMIMGLVDCV